MIPSQEHSIPKLRTTLKPGDIGSIIHLHGILYARECGWDHTFEGYVAEGLAKFAISCDPCKDRIWITEVDGRIIGCISIVGYSETEAQLRWFLMHPDLRGRGLGKKLIDEAIQFSRDCGFKSIFLWTTSNLKAAARLYESVGFSKTDEKTHQIWGQILTEERWDLTL